jgi:hypothetical protein
MNGVFMDKEFKIILKPQLARKLLHLGNEIYDIKPDKDDFNRSVFIFKNTDKFKNDLTTLTKG